MRVWDVIIIGAGQCGVYAARLLQKRSFDSLLLERSEVGSAWKQRLLSTPLFTSRQFSQLPELALPGVTDEFPLPLEISNYLKSYVKKFNLNVREKAEVTSVKKHNGLFLIYLRSGEEFLAKTVINATGSNQVPHIPKVSDELSENVMQYTSQLTSLKIIPDNCKVAVIGGGASGRQIAGGLANRCDVTLATGAPRALPPNRVLGKDLFWWLKLSGIIDSGNSSIVARILKKRNPVPCAAFNNRRLTELGVTIRSRLISCAKETLIFTDGLVDNVEVVIWATGYRDYTHWLKLPHCIDRQGFIHSQGLTPEPGLFVLGRKWFSCRGSELILGVHKDATHVVSLLENHMKNKEKQYEE
ncbi:flavin-containing monooxygenase [Alteromonas sp. ASW11-130]|uniref:flavin-containing monooxygenase n=1 Tax=Alteromonas sp. ASW11-130 TaxID=3015775 RepID=UPI002242C16D|nr:NAD(P)-binding domain-containing protein [Alteromonas sp. ASW11-130]MCW8093455.1 NAD(P)-binding domain-containing protein [Alteromonas sp. ASW11-130]